MNHVFSPSFSSCFLAVTHHARNPRVVHGTRPLDLSRDFTGFSPTSIISRDVLSFPLSPITLSLSLFLPFPRESALTRIRSRVSRSLDDRLSDSLLFLSERSADSWRMNLTWYVRIRPGSIYHSRCKTVPDLPSPLLSSPTPRFFLF